MYVCNLTCYLGLNVHCSTYRDLLFNNSFCFQFQFKGPKDALFVSQILSFFMKVMLTAVKKKVKCSNIAEDFFLSHLAFKMDTLDQCKVSSKWVTREPKHKLSGPETGPTSP